MRDLCIVTVADRCDDGLGPALCSLLARTGWLDLEVVVVDTGDGVVSAYVEENFLDVRTLRCPHGGVAYAANRALENAQSRYLLFVDPGLELCEGNLSSLVATLDRRPEVGLAGVRRVARDGSELPGRRYLHAGWTAGFIAVRRTAMEATGWFDERFFAFAEKADLCLRMQRMGWKVMRTTRLTVRSQSEPRNEPWLEAHEAHARMRLARKHFPGTAAYYRWALVGWYGLRFGVSRLLSRHDRDRGRAARAAFATVLRGRPTLGESSAA